MIYTIIKYTRYLIPLFIGFKAASFVDSVDQDVGYFNESKLEKITKNRAIVKDPDSSQKYIIDFENMQVVPYNARNAKKMMQKKELEMLIEE